jgi:hypothetical protein
VAATGTPDGSPPAAEEPCAGQSGAALGLCTAYCEAMDCDAASPTASPQACGQVGDGFEALTGERPPCERCPCNRPGGYWEAFVAIDPALGDFICFNDFVRLHDVAVLSPAGAPLLYAGANPTIGFCNDIVSGFPQVLDGATAELCRRQLQAAVDTYGVTCLRF